MSASPLPNFFFMEPLLGYSSRVSDDKKIISRFPSPVHTKKNKCTLRKEWSIAIPCWKMSYFFRKVPSHLRKQGSLQQIYHWSPCRTSTFRSRPASLALAGGVLANEVYLCFISRIFACIHIIQERFRLKLLLFSVVCFSLNRRVQWRCFAFVTDNFFSWKIAFWTFQVKKVFLRL